jgi:hypothetical protein
MADATQRSFSRVNGIIAPLLFIAGVLATSLGIVGLAVGRSVAGLLLLFGGMGAVAVSLLLSMLLEIANHLAVIRTQLKALELLTDVADHLQAMRAQMGKGVFGLLGK